MARLFLHVGLPKTGTSFIQFVLAKNIERLAEAGITYPLSDGGRKLAEEGGVTSGNGLLLLEPGAQIDADGDVLLSNEGLFKILLSKKRRLAKEFIARHGFDDVRILFFLRNPLEHAESHYHQAIKRGGFTDTLDAFFDKYNRPTKALEFLRENANIEGAKITVHNYSDHRRDLLSVLSAWLGVELEQGESSDAPKSINRSLSRAELVIQKKGEQGPRTVRACVRGCAVQSFPRPAVGKVLSFEGMSGAIHRKAEAGCRCVERAAA